MLAETKLRKTAKKKISVSSNNMARFSDLMEEVSNIKSR